MNEHARKGISRRALLRGAGTALGASLCAKAVGEPARVQADARATDNEGEAVVNRPLTIPTWYYKHHDADFDLDVPEEGFGGWNKADLEFSREHTAVVSMHAWDMGTFEEFPGWWRVVPWVIRAQKIVRDVYPPLLKAVRESDLALFHIVGGGDYCGRLPGYKHAVELAGPAPSPVEKVESDPIRDKLYAFRQEYAYTGLHNAKDIERGFARVDFPDEARPQGNEGIAENGQQLFALCKERGINHLIYCGFAINWCLLLSPGGMAEMQKYGLMCSALRQATTAVENKETAPLEICKEVALWRVALAFGFVFDVDDFIAALG